MRIIILAAENAVLIFEDEAGYTAALDYDASENEGRLSEYLRERGYRFIRAEALTVFEQK